MNKAEFIEALAAKVGGSKKDALIVTDAMIGIIQGTVADGNEVAFSGFGTFKSTAKAARKGRNPKTGKEIEIAAKKSPVFKPGSAFKGMVNS